MRKVLVLVTFVLLSGCSSLPPTQVAKSPWQTHPGSLECP